MRPIDDSFLTPDERRSEVAGILAAGVLRLSAMALPATDAAHHLASANPQESAPSCLEVPDETVLSVHNG
ncbi:MAG: hypothetical protein SH868_09675 [Bythopirellula sp.]|nr:hypothetical protein [Bythopirellula sp.]